MIIDAMTNVSQYFSAVDGLEGAVEYLVEVRDHPVGRYTNGIYTALVQEDDTEDICQALLESHRRFIDLQVVLGGREGIRWNSVSASQPVVSYDAERDVMYHACPSVAMVMEAGMFYLCLPSDGHACKGLADGKSERCRKICIKIRRKE